MDKLNWLTAYQIITKEAVLFTHKIVFNKQPQSITNLIIFSLIRFQNVHSAQKPMKKTYEKLITMIKENHNPQKKIAPKSIFFMGAYQYNKLT